MAAAHPSLAIGSLHHLRLGLQRAALRTLMHAAPAVRRATRRPVLPPHLLTGLRGEMEAIFFLRRQGYTIAARRWRTPELDGDLDIVAWHADTLCFIEVKTRTARDLYPPEAAVHRAKQRMLRRMAAAWRRHSLPADDRRDVPYRFDVVSILLLEGKVVCDLLPAAFPTLEQPHSRAFVV